MTATIHQHPTTRRQSRWIKPAETAKLVRRALKEAFPDVKFSVVTDTYAGGASINVNWTDGPHPRHVEAIAKVFQGAYFDGMTDYKGGHEHEMAGELVHFGANFIFCKRTFSDDVMAKAVALIEPLSADDRMQAAFRFDVHQHFNPQYDDARRLAWLITHNHATPQFEGRTSALAASVILVRSY